MGQGAPKGVLWGVAVRALGLGGREVMWGARRMGLLGLSKTRSRIEGRGRECTVLEHPHSLRSPQPCGETHG